MATFQARVTSRTLALPQTGTGDFLERRRARVRLASSSPAGRIAHLKTVRHHDLPRTPRTIQQMPNQKVRPRPAQTAANNAHSRRPGGDSRLSRMTEAKSLSWNTNQNENAEANNSSPPIGMAIQRADPRRPISFLRNFGMRPVTPIVSDQTTASKSHR